MADQIKLGVLIDEHQYRDAIHIAVAPVVAAEDLLPGTDIGLLPGSQDQASRHAPAIGIVDPFLKQLVKTGQRFYMFLYPQTITSLRHEWTHPAFTAETVPESAPISSRAASVKWLHEFAEEIDLSYDACMRAIRQRLEYGDCYIFHGHDTPDVCHEKLEDMWRHYEIVTGTAVEDKNASVFSCSC